MTPMRYHCVVSVLLVLCSLLPISAATNDISFQQVLLPRFDDTTRYTYLDSVPLSARFINAGTATQTDVMVTVTARWTETGAVITTESVVVAGAWLPGEERDIVFKAVRSVVPPSIIINFCAKLSTDEVPANDCSSASGLDTLLIYYAYDFQPAPLASYQHSPHITTTYQPGDTIPVRMAIRNNGIIGHADVPLSVDIYAPDGRQVYQGRNVLDSVPGESTVVAEWKPFIPQTSGRYCVRLWSDFPQEPLRVNDTLRWCFTVGSPTYRDGAFLGANDFRTSTKHRAMRPTTFTAHFRNAGMDTLYNTPIQIMVHDEGANMVWMDTLHVSGPWPENTMRTVIFPLTIERPGRYRFTFCSQLVGDENPANDCSSIQNPYYAEFFRAFDIEAGAAASHAHGPLVDTIHHAGKSIDVKATVINHGIEQRNNVQFHARIDDPIGNALLLLDTVVAIGPEDTRLIRFGSFTPPAPGSYCVTAWSSHSDDPVRTNDTTRWCFEAAWEFDIAVGKLPLHPHSPHSDSMYMATMPIDVHAIFLNHGVQLRRDVPLKVQIREANGTLVFDRDTLLAGIGPGERVEMRFDRFIPMNSGNYYISFWSDDPDDPQPANDSMLLSFVVEGTSGIDDEAEKRGMMLLSVLPAMANDVVDIRYCLEQATVGSITIYDELGRQVHQAYSGTLAQQGSVVVDVSGLTPGIYLLLLRTASDEILMNRVVILR